MKNLKKTLAIALSGVMMVVAAVAFTGCFGGGGGGTKTDEKVGTWVLAYAQDYYGQEISVTQSVKDSVYLKVESATKATFYFMDDDPFPGKLERYADRDSYYAQDGYKVQAYKLQGDDGYWELVFVVPNDGSDSFWYLEIGADQPESLFLQRR